MDIQVIIIMMSDTELNQIIYSFIEKKVFLIFIIQLLIPKISIK